MKRIYGRWESLDGLREDFGEYSYVSAKTESPVPDDLDVVFAAYGGGSYNGSAVVVFRRDGKLWEVHGSHCSCMGLEHQWKPEEATVESLRKTVTEKVCGKWSDYDLDARMAWPVILQELESTGPRQGTGEA